MTVVHILIAAGFVSLFPLAWVAFRHSLRDSLYLDGRAAFHRGERMRLSWPAAMKRGYRDARGTPHSGFPNDYARRHGL